MSNESELTTDRELLPKKVTDLMPLIDRSTFPQVHEHVPDYVERLQITEEELRRHLAGQGMFMGSNATKSDMVDILKMQYFSYSYVCQVKMAKLLLELRTKKED